MQPDIEKVERSDAGVGKPFRRLYLGVVCRSIRAFTLQEDVVAGSKFHWGELYAKVDLTYSARSDLLGCVTNIVPCQGRPMFEAEPTLSLFSVASLSG